MLRNQTTDRDLERTICRRFNIPTRYAGAIRTWRSTPSLRAAKFEDEDDDDEDENEEPCDRVAWRSRELIPTVQPQSRFGVWPFCFAP